MLPRCDLNTTEGQTLFEQRLKRLRETVSMTGEVAEQVAAIVNDVREDGDSAVVKYMRKWTDPTFDASRIVVDPEELKKAAASIDSGLCDVLKRAIDHVHEYQTHVMPQAPSPVEIDGATLGMRFSPVDSAGLAVPGGRAAYPSSVIMLAIPAKAAGVDPSKICVVTPPPTRTGADSRSFSGGDISPMVLAACHLCGVEMVYRIGGAQAVAALAFGTEMVKPVDLIVGPGNAYTQIAKAQVCGRVGIDGFYGPSEIVTIADDSANPARIAADLIAQAEHDPGKCFLVTWSRGVIDAVMDEVVKQIEQRARREPIEKALKDESCAVLARDRAQAIDIANLIAAEHVNIAVKDPQAMLTELRHGGEFFLGDQTPVAAGDYFSGPSHCLPTGMTARFASGISVYTFLKRSGTVCYEKGMSSKTIDAIAKLAEAEGLDGHAASVRIRDRR